MPARPAAPAHDAAAVGRALRHSHLAAALGLITEPWTNMVLREAFMGTRQFEMFQQRLGVPRQTLSLRLASLVEVGLLHKRPHPDFAARQEYRLTARGRELHANVLAAWRWDRRWGDPLDMIPRRLLHLRCGHAFKPEMHCEHCGQAVTLAQMQPELRAARRTQDAAAPPRGRRLRSAPAPGTEAGDPAAREILAVIDDRWSILIVMALMLGLRRYDEIAEALGISSAVLARRLQRLCQLELLSRRPDATDARRTTYALAAAGRDLFPYLMSLSRWGAGLRAGRDTVAWRHGSCGHTSQGVMACSHCSAPLLPAEVRAGARPAAPRSVPAVRPGDKAA